MMDGRMTDSPPTVTGAVPVTRRTPLTAVVVTRGLTRYLPATLAAVAAQTRPAARVVVVDAAPAARPTAGSAADDVTRLVGQVFAEHASDVHVVPVPGARTFGHAVRDGLTPLAPDDGGGWLWLLHDDSAPAPTALAELVRVVEHAPSVAVAGAKQRGWDDPARLLELGVSTSRLGRRMTGVEAGEVDQGQHDGREDVLAVGLAGALVRRDVWDELGGTDPSLGPFGDGLDLCRRARLAGHRVVVVPRAVVQHAQASMRGVRADDRRGTRPDDGPAAPPDVRRSYAARRRAHVHARLAAAPLLLVPLLTVGFLVSGLVRALLRIATKEVRLAAAEVAAPVVAVLHPARMARSRAQARRVRRLPRRSLRALQTTWRDVLREERDRALGRVSSRRVVRAPSELEITELAALTGRRRAGLAALVVAVGGLTVAVVGSLVVAVTGGRTLVGGGLLPADGDLGTLWRSATSGWVEGGLGAAVPADPLLAVLLPVAAAAGGGVQAAAQLLFLGTPVLAGLGAWFAAGAATRSVALRWWAAVVWLAAPSLGLALDGGRLGAAVAHAALPWAALGVARALGVQRTDVVLSGMVGARTTDDDESVPSSIAQEPAAEPIAAAVDLPAVDRAAVDLPGAGAGSVTAAAAAGLAFAVAAAGAPVLLPAGLLALVAVAAAARGQRLLLALVALPALAVAGPMLADAAGRLDRGGWRALLAEPGLPVGSTTAPAWQVLLGWPTIPGAELAPAVGDDAARVLAFALGGTLLVLALLALLRGRAVARGVRAGWVVAAVGLAAAVAAGQVETAVVDGAVVRGWAGAGVSLTVLGLLTAATLGADGARARTARYAFGWRQVGAVALTVVAVVAPLATLAGWLVRVHAGDEPRVVAAVEGPVVPAVGQQAQTSGARSRVLALAPDGGDGVTYQLWRGDGPQLTEASAAWRARPITGPVGAAGIVDPDDATAELEQLVARLGAGAAGDVTGDLGALGVAAVLVPPASSEARAELVGRLDSTAGLERITEGETGVIWRVLAPSGPAVVTSWARLVTPGADGGPASATPLDAGPLTVRDRIAPGADGRVVVLAERSAPGWRAWLDGRPLPTADAGWRQAFDVGPDGGLLTVRYAPPSRAPWLVAQGLVLGLTVLLALPVRRRRGGPALLGAVTVGAMRLPGPASDAIAGSVVQVPPTATTLVCPGPVVLPADDAAGDEAFDPAPVQTLTTQRVATVPAAPSAGAPDAAPAAGATTVTPLEGGAPLLRLDGADSVGGLDAVGGPTLLRSDPVGEQPATVGGATASITPQGDLRGLAAASCLEPSASTWLVGGSTEIGSSALLVVANPGRTPAEVSLDVWGPTGALDAGGAATFLVAPGAQRGVLLEGVAAEQRRIAVHVTAAGGLVSAHLQDSRLQGFTPAGTDLVTAGAAPATRQVVGGVVVPDSSVEQPDAALVRVLAPGDDRAVARLTVLGPDGPVSLPGAESLELGPGEVTDVSLAGLPAGAYTVVVDADVPVVAGAMITRPGDPVELGDLPTLERAWSSAGRAGATGVVALPPGLVATVVVGGIPAVVDDVLEDGAGTAGPPATAELVVIGADGTTVATALVEVAPGHTVRVDPALLAPGVDVAAVRLVPSPDADADAAAPVDPDAPAGTHLTWSVLATIGASTQELLSVLTPVPAPDARPAVVVRAGDRLGLP
jgi:GT2 family glycosyltransferase